MGGDVELSVSCADCVLQILNSDVVGSMFPASQLQLYF